MSVSTKHPQYTSARHDEWKLCADAYAGESAIKAAGEKHLPKPSGYSNAGGHADDGDAAYTAYKTRASFPEILANAVAMMLGIIHDKSMAIEMPDAMRYLIENADNKGTALADLHRHITRALLVQGRFGVLADAPMGGGEPYLTGYAAPRIINWDTDFFVLDESGYVRDGFSWVHEDRYRVLRMLDGQYSQETHIGGAIEDITPTRQGGGGIGLMPFAVASAMDMGADIDTPPLVGVARAAKAIYQLSADYRLQLYMSGQETLVALNGEAPSAVGAGVVHTMIGTPDQSPDLKYVSPSCAGIQAHLDAMQQFERVAVQAGARMFEQGGRAQESGEARRLRFKSETASIQTVAQSSCALLERGLRAVAAFKNLDPDDVTVTAPDDLLDGLMSPQDAAALWSVCREGGLSWETYYRQLQRGGIADPEVDAEEEYTRTQGREFEGADGP